MFRGRFFGIGGQFSERGRFFRITNTPRKGTVLLKYEALKKRGRFFGIASTLKGGTVLLKLLLLKNYSHRSGITPAKQNKGTVPESCQSHGQSILKNCPLIYGKAY